METKEDFLKRVQSYSPEELREALYGYSIELDGAAKDRVHLGTENHNLRTELKKQQEAIVDLQQELETCKGERDTFKNCYNSANKELEQIKEQEDKLKTTIRILSKLV